MPGDRQILSSIISWGKHVLQRNAIQQETNDTWQIDVGELAAGSYILEVILPRLQGCKKTGENPITGNCHSAMIK